MIVEFELKIFPAKKSNHLCYPIVSWNSVLCYFVTKFPFADVWTQLLTIILFDLIHQLWIYLLSKEKKEDGLKKPNVNS